MTGDLFHNCTECGKYTNHVDGKGRCVGCSQPVLHDDCQHMELDEPDDVWTRIRDYLSDTGVPARSAEIANAIHCRVGVVWEALSTRLGKETELVVGPSDGVQRWRLI